MSDQTIDAQDHSVPDKAPAPSTRPGQQVERGVPSKIIRVTQKMNHLRTPTDQIILRSFSWEWALIPYTTYRFYVVPSDSSAFDCVIRYSDLTRIEAHHAVVQARLEGTPRLPTMPSAHSVPLVGKLFDNQEGTRMRGVDIQLYLYTLLSFGGGLRSTVLDVLRKHLSSDSTDSTVLPADVSTDLLTASIDIPPRANVEERV